MDAAAIEEWLNAPVSLPPPGVTAHLDHGENRNKEVLALLIISIILTTAAMVARLYSRAFITKKLHIEDYFGITAYLSIIAIHWCILDYSSKIGFFVHQWDLRNRMHITFGLNTYTATLSYAISMALLKSAILLSWRRIFAFRHTSPAYHVLSNVLIAVNVLFYGAMLVASIFTCDPIQKTWNVWIRGRCIDRKTRDIATSAMNVVLDVFIFALPQGVVWRLRMNWGRKVGLVVTFSVGVLVLICATGRLVTTVTAEYNVTPGSDITYKYSQLLLWASSEFPCMFLVFCVPALPKLVGGNSRFSRLMEWLQRCLGLGPASRQESDRTGVRTIGSWSVVGRRRDWDEEGGERDSVAELAVMYGGRLEGRESNECEHTVKGKDGDGEGVVEAFEVARLRNDSHVVRDDGLSEDVRPQPWTGS